MVTGLMSGKSLTCNNEKCNNSIYSSTKLTPIQASLKKEEGSVYKILLDKRKRLHPKFQKNDFVRVADLKRTSSK